MKSKNEKIILFMINFISFIIIVILSIVYNHLDFPFIMIILVTSISSISLSAELLNNKVRKYNII